MNKTFQSHNEQNMSKYFTHDANNGQKMLFPSLATSQKNLTPFLCNTIFLTRNKKKQIIKTSLFSEKCVIGTTSHLACLKETSLPS